MTLSHEFVLSALRIGAFRILPRSTPPYAFDVGAFNTFDSLRLLKEAYGSALRGALLSGRLRDVRVDVLFGAGRTSYLAPLLTAYMAGVYIPLKGLAFAVEDEGTYIGASLDGKQVVIIDDVAYPEAESSAAAFVRSQGGIVVGNVVAFEYGNSGSDDVLRIAAATDTVLRDVLASALPDPPSAFLELKEHLHLHEGSSEEPLPA